MPTNEFKTNENEFGVNGSRERHATKYKKSVAIENGGELERWGEPFDVGSLRPTWIGMLKLLLKSGTTRKDASGVADSAKPTKEVSTDTVRKGGDSSNG